MNKTKLTWSALSSNRKMLAFLLIYLIVGSILIFLLITVDLFNFQIFINATSYLFLSQNPYVYFPNQFPPNYFLFLMPTFFIYLHSGFNIIESIQFLKIFQMLISAASAYVVYLFILHYSGSKNRAMAGFAALLLSPVLIWVNFFQLEQSPVGIAFTLFALYVILVLADKSGGGFIMLFVGTILFWYSAFLYLIPISLIPTLLIYQKSKKKFMEFLIAMVLGFIIFYVPYTFHNMFDIIGGTAAIATVGSSGVGFTIIGLLGPNIFPPDTFQMFLKGVLSVVFLISIFIIPILLRLLKRDNIFLPITLSLISVFLLQTITNLDEFSWVLSFLTIFLAITLREKHLLLKLILSQLYDIPYILLFIINDSNWGVNGSGFFYLSYLQFHLNIDLYDYAWSTTVSKILILLGFASFVLLIIILIYKTGKKTKGWSHWKKFANSAFLRVFNAERTENDTVEYIKIGIDAMRFQSHSSSKKVKDILLMLSIVIILILSVSGTYIFHNVVDGSEAKYPFGFFSSEVVVGINTTYQFVNNYKSIEIYPTNSNYNYSPISPFVFSRNVTGEQLSMNLSLTPINTVGSFFNSTIFEAGNVSINIFNEMGGSKNNSNPTQPRLLISFVSQNTTEYTISNSTNFSFRMSSSQFTIFSENLTISGSSHNGLVSFGRLSDLSVPLILSINNLRIISMQPDSSFFTIVLDSIFIPVVSLVYILYSRRAG